MKFRIGKGIFEPLAWPAPVRPRRLKASRTHVPLYMGDVTTGPPPLAGASRPRARPGLGLSHAGRGVQPALSRRAAAPAPPAAAIPERIAPARCRVAAPAAVCGGRRSPPAPRGLYARAAARPSLGGQAPLHHGDGLRVLVDEHVPPPELSRDRSERAAPGEGVQAPVAGPGRRMDDASQHACGLLRRVASLLLPG